MAMETLWKNCEFVAFDTETSGGYPVGCDVVEFGAVRWKQGKIIDQFQCLIKPRARMSDFIISIHGITNEMVENAPEMKEVAPKIKDFFKGAIGLAHHAPFDLGFLAYEFERSLLTLPVEPVLCTSLLSRKLISGVPNHKLQTLVEHLKLNKGSAHRALDDAKACLEVGLHCFKMAGEEATFESLSRIQRKAFTWSDFALLNLKENIIQNLVQATLQKKVVEIIYNKGSHKGQTRPVFPLGIVRSPDGDFLQAKCLLDQTDKRFYLAHIAEAAITFRNE